MSYHLAIHRLSTKINIRAKFKPNGAILILTSRWSDGREKKSGKERILELQKEVLELQKEVRDIEKTLDAPRKEEEALRQKLINKKTELRYIQAQSRKEELQPLKEKEEEAMQRAEDLIADIKAFESKLGKEDKITLDYFLTLSKRCIGPLGYLSAAHDIEHLNKDIAKYERAPSGYYDRELKKLHSKRKALFPWGMAEAEKQILAVDRIRVIMQKVIREYSIKDSSDRPVNLPDAPEKYEPQYYDPESNDYPPEVDKVTELANQEIKWPRAIKELEELSNLID